ncbi:MAG: twin-arginine translocase subunit TatC [Candidatus Gastranaerophilales bacterium]|nr:twin-arginine translocase subunit TatC [Candidatus Gastranaerophilales bacterium]
MSEENQDDQDLSLIEHLEALRATLIKCFTSVAVILPFSFFFAPKTLDFLIGRLVGNNNITLNYFSPMEVFILQIKLALLLSLLAAFPYIAKKIWDFLLPALYEKERNFIRNIVFSSTLLFVFGVTFCLFVILPLIINFGMSFASSHIQAVFGISNIINLALGLSFTFGLMFQVPLVTHFLIKWDILSYEAISSKRPYVVVAILILAALLTPPDIVSQLLLFLPTYLLFELGLIFSKGTKRDEKV